MLEYSKIRVTRRLLTLDNYTYFTSLSLGYNSETNHLDQYYESSKNHRICQLKQNIYLCLPKIRVIYVVWRLIMKNCATYFLCNCMCSVCNWYFKNLRLGPYPIQYQGNSITEKWEIQPHRREISSETALEKGSFCQIIASVAGNSEICQLADFTLSREHIFAKQIVWKYLNYHTDMCYCQRI